MIVDMDLIIMSIGAILTLIGVFLGIKIIYRSEGLLKSSIIFLTTGLGLYVIYHILNLYKLGVMILDGYEYLVGIIHLTALLFMILSLIKTEKMILRTSKSYVSEKHKKKT